GTANNLLALGYGGGLFVGLGSRGTIQTSTNGDVWTKRPTSTTHTLSGIAYGNGRFVTVGNVGTIFTSDDGTNWTSVNSGFQNILNGVTYRSEERRVGKRCA